MVIDAASYAWEQVLTVHLGLHVWAGYASKIVHNIQAHVMTQQLDAAELLAAAKLIGAGQENGMTILMRFHAAQATTARQRLAVV